jgi:flagellar basal-body rod modification protein FlgD
MSVNLTTGPAATASPATATTPTPSLTSNAAVDQQTFLKLLVEQLKNQDPLSPQDGAQFVAQLAQFSSLDQLININQELGQLVKKS